MTLIARRHAAALLVGFAVVTAACGSSAKKTTPKATTTTAPAATSTTASTVAVTTTAATTTTTAPAATWTAIWPTAASTERPADPLVAARTFATEYLHFVAPVVGPFRQGDSRSGEVPIRAKSTGPVTTVLVRQLGTDGSWSVLGAATPHIVLTEPAALATITSPVTLRGNSSAYEATVNFSIRQDDHAAALKDGYVMGGSLQLGPFSGTFTFPKPTSRYGAIVMYTISPEDGHVAEASAIRVRFSAS